MATKKGGKRSGKVGKAKNECGGTTPKPLSLLSREAQNLYSDIAANGKDGSLWGPLPASPTKELMINGHIQAIGPTVWTTEEFNKMKASDKPPESNA